MSQIELYESNYAINKFRMIQIEFQELKWIKLSQKESKFYFLDQKLYF